LELTRTFRIALFNSAYSFIFFYIVNVYNYINLNRGTTTIYVDLYSYKGGYLLFGEFNLSNILDPTALFVNSRFVRYELADVKSYNVSNPSRVTITSTIPRVVRDVLRIAKSASIKPSYRYIYLATEFRGLSPRTEVLLGRLGDGMNIVQIALFSSLAKTDWETRRVIRWQLEDGESCPCEPIFI